MAIDHFKIDKGLSLTPRPGAPLSPTNGDAYYDAPTQRFRFYENGVWKDLGSGGSGTGINYLQLDPTITPDFEENTVAGWSTYLNTVPGPVPEVSPGGTPNVNFTFASTNSSPLRGSYSGLITKDAANRQGHGIRTSGFNIDRIDQGNQLFVTFDFEALGTYNPGDIQVFLSDGGQIITPSNPSIPQGKGSYTTAFQATTSSSYRLYFHVATTNAAAYTLKLDNLSVGPEETIIGAAISEWVLTTTTAVSSTDNVPRSLGSTGNTTMYMRREGDSVRLKGQIDSSGSGRFSSGDGVSFRMPPGLLIDSTKNYTSQGLLAFKSVGPNIFQYGNVQSNDTTGLIDVNETDGNGYTSFSWSRLASPTTSGQLVFEILVPVTNWDSNVVIKTGREEFVFNTGSNTGAGTSDLTSFGSGAAGTPTLAYNSTTVASSTNFRCRFQNPIQPTDVIELEIQKLAGGPWEGVAMGAPYSYANTTAYGARIDAVSGSTTDVDVSFNNGGKTAANAATYGTTNGDPWSTVAGVWRWRVRKAAGPTAVEATSLTQSIAVTDWQSYTPDYGIDSGSGWTFGTGGGIKGKWRRVGDSMQVRVVVEGGSSGAAPGSGSGNNNYYVKLPSGYNIDSSKIIDNGGNVPVGFGYIVDSLVNTYTGTVLNWNGQVSNSFILDLDGQPNGIGPSRPTNNWFGNNDLVSFEFTVPIIGWDSVVKIQDGREEFAWNSNISTQLGAGQSDTTSFGHGPGGVRFGAFNSTTTGTVVDRYVKFNDPIQPTDIITLEYSQDGGTTWSNVGDSPLGIARQNSRVYGMYIYHTIGTDTVNIQFGNAGAQSSGSGSYDNNGQDWANIASDPLSYWRVRKAAGPTIVQANPGYLAAISEWQAYTPTLTGFGTPTGVSFFWRQVGDSIDIWGTFTSGTPSGATALITLPNNYFMDFSKQPTGGTNNSFVGHWGLNAVRTDTKTIIPFSNDHLAFGAGATGDLSNPQPGNVVASPGQIFNITARLAIIGLSSNINVQNATEEYAWNSGVVTAAGASDTTSFGHGPQGTPVLAYNSTTGAQSDTTFRVQFLSPIQPSDILKLEFRDNADTNGTWIPVEFFGGRVMTLIWQNQTIYGVDFDRVTNSPNQINVEFANGGRLSNPSTYGGVNASPWLDLTTGAGYNWRVRKTSAPGIVGFQPTTADIKGRVTGVQPAAGYFGEQVLDVQAEFLTYPSDTNVYNVYSFTLQPGVYDIDVNVVTLSHTNLVARVSSSMLTPVGPTTLTGAAATCKYYATAFGTNDTNSRFTTMRIRAAGEIITVPTTYYLNTRFESSSGDYTSGSGAWRYAVKVTRAG